MKRVVLAIAAIALLLSCQPEKKTGKRGGGSGPADVTTVPDGAVDLGVVFHRSDGTTYNLYWAESNLSKNGLCPNPEDYGDYYAWGETEPKNHYSWITYKWCEDINYNLTRYCPASAATLWGGTGAPDNKTEFSDYNYADDAARANVRLGGKWRMPTDAEWTELRNSCTWTWKTDYNGSGINGILVTSSNGNSIFLPAGGYLEDGELLNAGTRGDYWSSSLSTGSPKNAWYAYFNSGGVYRGGSGRYYGRLVRPVTE